MMALNINNGIENCQVYAGSPSYLLILFSALSAFAVVG